jgi:hypothetical protein
MHHYLMGQSIASLYWSLTIFWEILGHVDLFWDFNSLSKEEKKTKWRSRDIDPFLGPFWDMGICNGNGTLTHGFTHV